MSERLNALLRLANNWPTVKKAVIPERPLSGYDQRPVWPIKRRPHKNLVVSS